MGREVRRVDKEWQHPKDGFGKFEPLLEEEMPQFKNPSHYQMYETTTEGTPISPVIEAPEALAQWLVDNEASAFAGQPASYGAWLEICRGKPAISGVITRGEIINGVEARRRFQ